MPNQDKIIEQLINEGYSDDEIVQALSEIESEGKTTDPQQEDAIVGLDDTASKSEEPSSVSPEEFEQERSTKESAYRAAHSAIPGAGAVVGSLPDFLLEPYAAFESTLLGFGSGIADFATQQYARFDKAKYKADEQGTLTEDETGQTVSELLEDATPEERNQIWDAYNTAGDTIRDAVDASQFAEQRGSGSISTELANGNIANAAQLTANQTAAGLASLVPFMVPGGTIIGPAVLGSSAAAGEFETYIDEGKTNADGSAATMDQIYNASYLKGGAEFATEFVTAGILGRASKLARGGASKELVDRYTKGAVRSVLGDAFAEGVSEGATDTAGRFIDKAVFGDDIDWKDAAVGFIDSAIVGAIVGGKVSTFGATAATAQGKQYAAQALRTEAQKNEDNADAQEIQAQTDAINEINAKATEGSLVDEVLLEQAEQARDEAISRVQERKKEHVRTLDDMTKTELVEYAKSLEASKAIAEQLKDKTLTDDAKAALENKKTEEDSYANEQYDIVQQWPAITKEAADIEARIDEELKLVEMEEAQAAKAEQPNPVGTHKRNTKKKELEAKKKGLNEELDSKRPTVAEAKTRKRKAKSKPVEVAKDAVKPIKDKAKRAEANSDLIETIKDPDIPQPQKEKAWNDFFKVNAPLVTSIASQVGNKTGRTDRKDIRDLVKTELTKQIEKKGALDNKAINNASKSVERLLKSEESTVRTPRQDSVKQEIRAIDQEVLDGTLDPEAAEILKDDIRNEAASTVDLETGTEEGTEVPAYIEKAYQTSAPVSQEQKKVYDKILKDGGSVEGLIKDVSNNTQDLFKLLPESAKSGKAFSGIFSGGNPPVEVWESYFDKSDRKGKDRLRELKKAIDKNLSEVNEEASTTSIDNTEAFTDSIEFLESDGKIPVKVFLPLLAKLKRNFPGTKILISKAKMIEDFIEAGIDPAKVDQVKGYTDGKNVVLNPDKLDAETPIHEFGHIWAQTTRQERPDLYKKGAELIKKSSEYLELQEKVKDESSVYYGKTREQVIEEAMATAIGKHGEEIFKSKEDQSQWEKLRKQIWDYIGKKLGIAKVEDLTLDQFVKLAATEIITGEKFITQENLRDMEVSLAPKEAQYLVVPSGTTRDYAQSTAPIVEADTHGVFKGAALSKEIDGLIDKHGPALEAGGWIGWITGSYGAAVEGTSKFNPKLNARIQAKVDGMRKALDGKGYTLRQDPVNPGFHVIRKKPELNFAESDLNKAKNLKKLLNGNLLYKKKSPYKKSKIDQATREVLNATKRDFALRGHLLNEAGLNQLIHRVEDLIKHGKDAQKAKLDNAKSLRKAQAAKAADIVSEVSGVDVGSLTPAGQARRAKDQGTFLKDLKKGRVADAFARLLSPDSNNDFYGLLYNLMPKGSNRNATKEYLKENITDTLEDANYNYLQDEAAFSQNWKDIMKQHGYTRKSLGKNSGILVDGLEISDSQVAKLYNYIKDPSLYKQLEKGGVNAAKMNELLDYLDANPKLKALADQVPDIYSGAQSTINQKLDEHGFKGVQNPDIIKPEPGPNLDVLARVYNGTIPLQAPYTPFTAQGADTSLEIENVFEGEGDYYSVMSGNLKRRTGGGAVDIHGKNLESDIDGYRRGPLRTQAYLDFARNSSNFFSGQNMKGMEAAFGSEWSTSMKDSLKRIITGRNNPTNETKSAKAVRNFINNTVGGIMFLNTRSAVLQLISTANFSVKNPKLYGKGLLSNKKKEALKLIQDSAWYKARGQGRSQLELAEIFDSQKGGAPGKALQKILETGYKLTQLGDKGAIAYGGAPLVAALLEQGMNPDQALKEFIRQSEETQQSVRAERLGREQTSTFGRAILAFANTPMQYNRKMQKALKDLTAKGSTKEQKIEAARSIIYYGTLQNGIFTAAQQGLWTAVGLDDKEDEDKVVSAVNSMADTILRGSGIYGAVAATMKNIIREFMKDDKRLAADKAAQALVNTVPALGTKVRQLKKAAPGSRLYRESKGPVKIDASVIRAANAVTFVTNVPLDRAVKKLEGINDLAAKDLNEIEKMFRVLGWGRYNLGKKGTPLKRAEGGVWGRANKDGSIEINPNLSPAQKKQTLEHEKAHQREMDSGKLDYDDSAVYYDGQTYPRREGQIEIGGKLVPEGDSSLPWEQVAESAESPLRNNGDDPPKPGTPEWEKAVAEGKQFNKDWYNDPTAAALFEEQAPRFKGGASDRYQTIDETHFDEGPASGAVAEYWRNSYPEEGDHKHNVEINPDGPGITPELVAHESTHAAGFDYDLGKVAKGILGESKRKDSYGRYLNNPDEQYANLQELRKVLGLRPDQRDLTPAQLEKLAEEKGTDDVKAYIKNFGADKVSKAHNKVASLDDLKSKYSNIA